MEEKKEKVHKKSKNMKAKQQTPHHNYQNKNKRIFAEAMSHNSAIGRNLDIFAAIENGSIEQLQRIVENDDLDINR